MTDDQTLLMKQCGQVETMESTLEEIWTTQTTLVSGMKKIQNYVMQDTNQDETPNVDESLAIFEPIPPLVGLLGEIVIFSEPSRKPF